MIDPWIVAQSDQVHAAFRTLAELASAAFDEFQQAGFTRPEALTLTDTVLVIMATRDEGDNHVA